LVAAAARRERRVLITLDRDFSDIRAYPPNDHAGIVVLRPEAQDKHSVEELLQRLLVVLDSDSPAGELWIVEPDRLRRRS
jgi:predicted nuclease of predicted toxin-antitoxin system